MRVQLQFRGREMAHQEFGMQLMEKVRDDLAGMSQVEMEPKIAGRNVTMTLSPLPAARRKRRFSVAADDAEDAEERRREKTAPRAASERVSRVEATLREARRLRSSTRSMRRRTPAGGGSGISSFTRVI